MTEEARLNGAKPEKRDTVMVDPRVPMTEKLGLGPRLCRNACSEVQRLRSQHVVAGFNETLLLVEPAGDPSILYWNDLIMPGYSASRYRCENK